MTSILKHALHYKPASVDDERRLYRPTPIILSSSSVMLINEFGASVLTEAQTLEPLDLPNGDEVMINSNGMIYACQYNGGFLYIHEYQFCNNEFLQRNNTHSIKLPHNSEDDFLILGTPHGIELWIDNPKCCQRIWALANKSENRTIYTLESRPSGEFYFSSGKVLAFAEDRGVEGQFLNVFELATCKTWTIRSDYAFTAIGQTFAISRPDITDLQSNYGLYSFHDGQSTFIKTPGPVIEAAGDSQRIIAAVFTGKDIQLLDIRKNNKEFSVHHINTPSGYKGLSLDGNAYTVRGFSDIFTVNNTPQEILDTSLTDLLLTTDTLYEQAEYLISPTPTNAKATVIHFHGGPEGYEVPESRIFGLPQWCNTHNINWIGVNYRGSLLPHVSSTQSAWHHWRTAIEEDFFQIVNKTNEPLILVGWSFGAALALALANSHPNIRALILGGTLGNLQQHVSYANQIDENHKNWFQKRFDLVGDDSIFLNGISGFRSDIHILEFHGEEDSHCPIQLANATADQWKAYGNPWKRISLPSKQHYASTPADIELITTAIHDFLRKLLQLNKE